MQTAGWGHVRAVDIETSCRKQRLALFRGRSMGAPLQLYVPSENRFSCETRHELAAGSQDATYLLERDDRVRQVLQQRSSHHQIEWIVSERPRADIHVLKFDGYAQPVAERLEFWRSHRQCAHISVWNDISRRPLY